MVQTTVSMRPARKHKLMIIIFLGCVLSIATALVLYALRQNISLFYTPTQLVQGQGPANQMIRVGGMVVKGSLIRSADDLKARFKITDFKNTIEIEYKGILPDLFREGQGIVAQGRLLNFNKFSAIEVLAKHDENYMPPEVKEMLAPNNKGAANT
jgi:cytochrome c-type biogenesis protein CcmE